MLQIEAGRHKNLLMCILYIIVLEDAYQLLMLCPAYTE